MQALLVLKRWLKDNDGEARLDGLAGADVAALSEMLLQVGVEPAWRACVCCMASTGGGRARAGAPTFFMRNLPCRGSLCAHETMQATVLVAAHAAGFVAACA